MFSKFLNKEIVGIIVSGYTEVSNGFHFFQPMYDWIFLETNEYQFIKLSSNYGNIKADIINNIDCNFEIEDNDIFTLMYIENENLGTIERINYRKDKEDNLIEIDIVTSKKNIIFDSLTIDGFKIKIQ